jgi:plasmid stabilization system protein ParE
LKTVLTSVAKRDIEKAAQWYASRRDDVGNAFLDHVQDALSRIGLNPLAYRKVAGENRRCNLARFPYAIYFKVAGDAIVVACLHSRRDPKLAKERGKGITPLSEPL